MTDDLNPLFLFSLTDTKLLVGIVNKTIDSRQLAIAELKKRGLDKNGERVGF